MPIKDCTLETPIQEPTETKHRLLKEAVAETHDGPYEENRTWLVTLLRAFSAWPT